MTIDYREHSFQAGQRLSGYRPTG